MAKLQALIAGASGAPAEPAAEPEEQGGGLDLSALLAGAAAPAAAPVEEAAAEEPPAD